jgi:hypothetical protein
MEWRASQCQSNSTKSLGTMVEVTGTGFQDSLAPMPTNGIFIGASGNFLNGKCQRFMGVFQCAATGSLANGATTQIPSFGGGIITGLVEVTFHGPTQNGAFTCAINATRTVRLATTDSAIADCTGNVPGDITIHYSSPSSIVLRNNLGEAVTYTWRTTIN